MGRTPLCLKCGAPAGDATASPKPLFFGFGWIVVALAAASQLTSMKMGAWPMRLAALSVLGVAPIAWFFRNASRSRTHWRCMRCRHEWPR